MPRWLRLSLLVFAGLLLAAVLAIVITVYLLLQPERFTAMLQTQARAAGLELNLASPASPSLFPHPALDLHGITLNARGATAPILLAARGKLGLPWRTLFGGPTVISTLQIDSPRVDLDALQAWLTTLPARPSGTPPNIPRIDTGVSINYGSLVRGNQLLLANVNLDAGRLRSGQPFPLSMSANTASGTMLKLRLSATPRIRGNALQLDNINLHLSQGGALMLQLSGSAYWHGAADAVAHLAGKLEHADAGQYAISLALTPADQSNPLLLALKLEGQDAHVDLRLPPLALARWWSQLGDPGNPVLTVPPGSGELQAKKIETGGITIEGLSMKAGDSLPASASTAAAPRPAAGKP
ncbi:MAG: AsmA family protein [Rhodanobacter sp.]|nr:MAG: AsmA family protein [Rhodanobacter sp.]